ncbi:unnamed protein product [Protopolystoma xenopodis]|uniref:CNNM transmembrane domain-containing protein n=1 Tax=Protopolystoma xenopodis TaxID=117903 RepID=A0A3S5FCW5_9PLAT|nr:unnamed protein product [Protopolystoma xenopodis]
MPVKFGETYKLRLFGTSLSTISKIAFIEDLPQTIKLCEDNLFSPAFYLFQIDENMAIVNASFTRAILKPVCLLMCSYDPKSKLWVYENHTYPRGIILSPSYPNFFIVILVFVLFILLLFSALFSGINIAFVGLDKVVIQIYLSAGSAEEKLQAAAVLPALERSNHLLCAIIFSNVLTNVSFSIVADSLIASHYVSIIFATIVLVFFGELLPQVICSKYPLLVVSKTIWITKFLLLATSPLTYPMGYIFDKCVGQYMGLSLGREKLVALVRAEALSGYVDMDEVKIITGALSLFKKTVKDIMTPLEHIFMISYNACLDFDMTNEIIANGFTRIPVYEGTRQNIRGLLNVKDLAFVDPNDKILVSTICNFYNRKFIVVSKDAQIRVMLNLFKKAGSSHIAIIKERYTDGQESHERIIGMITLEDVIEEILQEEIIDETDIINFLNIPMVGVGLHQELHRFVLM